MSEDISYRQRRYLISMGVRVVAFLLAVFLFHGVWRFIAAAIALVVPYFAVVFANGGREPDSSAAFEPFEPNLPEPAESAGASAVPAASATPEGTSAESTTGDGAAPGGTSGGDTASRDGTAHDRAAEDRAAYDRTAEDRTAEDRASANRARPGEGQAGWNASWQGDPRPREGEAFLSGKQADTRP